MTDFQIDGKWVHPLKYCFVKVLDNKIQCESEGGGFQVVPILTQFYPADQIPCISMSFSSAMGMISRAGCLSLSPLPEDHDYYDPAYSEEEYAQSFDILTENKSVMSFHIWANDPDQRDTIHMQLLQYLEEAIQFNYKYCRNYSDGVCATTNATCDATTTLNRFSVQYKCPFPDDRNAATWFDVCGVQRGSIKLRGEQYLEDTDVSPEVYRVVQEVDLVYNRVQSIPVLPACNYEGEAVPEEFLINEVGLAGASRATSVVGGGLTKS